MSRKSLNTAGVLLLSASFAPISVTADQLYFSFDNDIVTGADGDYSNGFVIGWHAKPEHNFSAASSAFQWQSALLFPQQTQQTHRGAQLYSRMWTPTEIAYDYPQSEERPYAACWNCKVIPVCLAHH